MSIRVTVLLPAQISRYKILRHCDVQVVNGRRSKHSMCIPTDPVAARRIPLIKTTILSNLMLLHQLIIHFGAKHIFCSPVSCNTARNQAGQEKADVPSVHPLLLPNSVIGLALGRLISTITWFPPAEHLFQTTLSCLLIPDKQLSLLSFWRSSHLALTLYSTAYQTSCKATQLTVCCEQSSIWGIGTKDWRRVSSIPKRMFRSAVADIHICSRDHTFCVSLRLIWRPPLIQQSGNRE